MVLDTLDGRDHILFTFAPDGSLFSPAGGQINAVDGIGELTGNRGAAVGDGIGF